MLKSLLTNEVKVSFTIDDVRLNSILTTNKTIMFTKTSFFYIILCFTPSHSGELGDIHGFVQLIPEFYKSDKALNIARFDKFHLKSVCKQGTVFNGIRESFLYSFALSSPPGHKLYKELRLKLFKKIKKPVLPHITFSLEDDDHIPVKLNGERISFSCQLIQI